MSIRSSAEQPPSGFAIERLLGRYDRGRDGPCVIVAAGIHGNEPSGIVAFHRVLDRLRRDGAELRGSLVGLAGNLRALAIGDRFIEEDLNRIWLPERLGAGRRASAPAASVDAGEQAELLQALRGEFGRARGKVFFLDLHTSSAPGQPFVCIGDTLRNRDFATRFGVPVILGLEEQVDGALLEYVNNLGHVTVGVEAGQHDDPRSIDLHESFVLLALVAAGCLGPDELAHLDRHRQRLQDAVGGLPPVLEVRHRHPIGANDGFQMAAGFSNFQPVSAGELVAHHARGAIRAPEAGRVLLPLYQGLGNDGFFIVREISPFWLRVSAVLRRLGMGRLAHWLPGVRRHPEQPDTLLADPRVARWFTVEIFHLLGYRKERIASAELAFSRRRE